ncbi:hypothetical protein AB0H71_04560 [Nocardia sp. NPDC050697]|uniref:hypothetical protein n=1 Tax=Nocardia sp. NPDC050697 TaxID=3155158 RepID=UPI0033D6B7BE
MTGRQAPELSAESDEAIARAIARWRAAHRAALDDGHRKLAEITGVVLDAFLAEAHRRTAAPTRPEPAAG